ncbi:MAG TPA: carbon storage regulator CsrA [Verrucomicrobiae bacterium]|jgi:carbon storage regulator|nr:carbon storage regulator CsrA [Verrucomicrobiae bacterium]
MLILSRKAGETIVIDGRIKVTVMRVDGEAVKIGIEAPANVPVHRQEVYDEIQHSNKRALTRQKIALPKLSGRHNQPGNLGPVEAQTQKHS